MNKDLEDYYIEIEDTASIFHSDQRVFDEVENLLLGLADIVTKKNVSIMKEVVGEIIKNTRVFMVASDDYKDDIEIYINIGGAFLECLTSYDAEDKSDPFIKVKLSDLVCERVKRCGVDEKSFIVNKLLKITDSIKTEIT